MTDSLNADEPVLSQAQRDAWDCSLHCPPNADGLCVRWRLGIWGPYTRDMHLSTSLWTLRSAGVEWRVASLAGRRDPGTSPNRTHARGRVRVQTDVRCVSAKHFN